MTRPKPVVQQARIRGWILIVLSENTAFQSRPYSGDYPEEAFFGQAKGQGWTAKAMEKAIAGLVDDGEIVSTVIDLGKATSYWGKRHPRFIPALRMP